jgi:16S rRNA (uracil1498-N3)-methyltransferase
MPATPAWPPASTPRLHVDQPLEGESEVMIVGAQAHYLAGVMRAKAGDPIRLFDDISGEWLAKVAYVGKRDLLLAIEAKLGPRETVPDLWLLMAPIKKGRIDWIVEKACELGVDRIVPVITQRTIVDKVNGERLRAHMIEAAEQCGRTALPTLAEPVKLDRLLADWPGDRALLFADETGGKPLADIARPDPAAILIGPEGGFTDEEREAIHALPPARAMTLGPRILRADTAMVAAVSLWMAAMGDWRSED